MFAKTDSTSEMLIFIPEFQLWPNSTWTLYIKANDPTWTMLSIIFERKFLYKDYEISVTSTPSKMFFNDKKLTVNSYLKASKIILQETKLFEIQGNKYIYIFSNFKLNFQIMSSLAMIFSKVWAWIKYTHCLRCFQST